MKILALLAFSLISSVFAADYMPIAGGTLRTALPTDGETVQVAAYRLRSKPVSNQDYLNFLKNNSQWQRGTIASLFAGAGYLANWQSPTDYSPNYDHAPVTQISWFAANAYCASEKAQLPTWSQWEFAAAADALRKDARNDPLWRAKILSWYAEPAAFPLTQSGQQVANIYGVYDLHQSIWEWVEDFNGLFVTTDSRSQGDQTLLETCGAASLSLGDKENYAILMRIALLAALNGTDTVNTLGFRCAKPMQ
ncbi:formylglycine-generating enzyme family protein [Iodobacter sp. CM08]|uniref:formylglycine-generating enzyme family protein n=1 Tax=Iodobacter sp. CM08 TaxID=3085902 RepID=UPI002982216A|nr:formylglycine-generating enzyme family protein [Iodobacter sp. CM08]MDW5417842.1 formylglycine-generating enzyme family protein [Iodobacter sp. CM08]